MTIYTVTLTGVTSPIEVYGGLVAGTELVRSMLSPAASAWLALPSNTQGQSLVEMTRLLDSQPWAGTATGLAGGIATTLQFARSGITGVDATIVPPQIVEAAFRGMVLLAANPSLLDKADQGSNVKMVGGAGVPSVEFFAPTSAAAGTATRLPVSIERLIGRFLAVPASDGSFGQGSGSCSRLAGEQAFPRRAWPY